MIFAKVDVDFRDNVRAQRAGEAMATWTWGLLYTRGQELDGHIPREALRASWAGESVALRHATKLVAVSLWEVTPEGWLVLGYAAKNDTKEIVAARRAETSARVSKHRNRVRNALHPSVTHAVVPGSGSGSDSKSLGSQISEQPASQSTEPPEWWAGVIGAVEMFGAPIADPRELWPQYVASRLRKTWAMNHEDAVGWLSSVRRNERQRRPAVGYGGRPEQVRNLPSLRDEDIE